jgi:photosystem II stability/assembly factor-like uncharacterized protein
MKKLLSFVLALLLLIPMSINATESDETEEAMETLSNDGTGTWEEINSGLTDTHITSLAIDPTNTSIIYAGTNRGVFKSTDGGGTWSVTGMSNVLSVLCLAIDSINSSTMYAGTDGQGIWWSTDGGRSWNTPPSGPPPVSNAVAIDPSNSNIVYEGTNIYGVVKWTNITTGGTYTYIYNPTHPVYALVIDHSNPDTIYAGTDGGAFKSTDGGATWIAINSGLTNTHVNTLAINPTNTSIIYAGTDGGIFKSANGGGSWSASGLANTHINVLAIDPSDPNFIYAGTNGGVIESTDGGASWSAINSGLTNTHVTSLAIDPSNPNIIYAGTDGGGVFKSSLAEGPPSLHVSKSGTGDGTVTSTPPGINCGSTCQADFTAGTSVTLTALADAGSVFTGWSGGGCSGTGPCTITLNSDTTIEASFALSGSCAYTISPTSKAFNAKGGNLSVNVSATGQTNCPVPPVVEDAEWISVSGTPTWKANKGTVKIAVQKNPGSQSRTGVVSIGGQTLTIKEDGAKCQLTALKPSSGKYPNTGGSGSFDITVSPQDCGWNVATTSGWIHLDTMTGTGNGTATFHMDANGTGKNRTGKIDVSLAQDATKKKTFSVNESK